jgi:hypothetical protein
MESGRTSLDESIASSTLFDCYAESKPSQLHHSRSLSIQHLATKDHLVRLVPTAVAQV